MKKNRPSCNSRSAFEAATAVSSSVSSTFLALEVGEEYKAHVGCDSSGIYEDRYIFFLHTDMHIYIYKSVCTNIAYSHVHTFL